MRENHLGRPIATVVLAMSADGKISDATRSPTLFGSSADKAHLETQVALADGVLGGAASLRAGGTAMRVSTPELLQQRTVQGKPPQPVQIICSRSGKIPPMLPFFRQNVPRWLLTTNAGAKEWEGQPGWERILVLETAQGDVDLLAAMHQLAKLGLGRLAVLGGGELVAGLLAAGCIDEMWLTVCPLVFGGKEAPTPVDGGGFSLHQAPRLQLQEVKRVEQEVFLHYRVQR
ncbi:MAG TPA: dihydrofolate reductase family protein [Oscillatoriaceae cyanobacterium M33_DOE_052]|uniref:Riboflavin deaminase n=1 Tax=Planktothricoides sp. SpSt-374 TaxID=2282167 RepID=A0A7C3ZHY5_9CYAN|nr:dihydrofolate reductase family protein [Oscillatoriaceae cyanobacterium M33_DOE_052]